MYRTQKVEASFTFLPLLLFTVFNLNSSPFTTFTLQLNACIISYIYKLDKCYKIDEKSEQILVLHLWRKGKMKENVMDRSFDFLLYSQYYTLNSKVVMMYVWFKKFEKKNIKKNTILKHVLLIENPKFINWKRRKKRFEKMISKYKFG